MKTRLFFLSFLAAPMALADAPLACRAVRQAETRVNVYKNHWQKTGERWVNQQEILCSSSGNGTVFRGPDGASGCYDGHFFTCEGELNGKPQRFSVVASVREFTASAKGQARKSFEVSLTDDSLPAMLVSNAAVISRDFGLKSIGLWGEPMRHSTKNATEMPDTISFFADFIDSGAQ